MTRPKSNLFRKVTFRRLWKAARAVRQDATPGEDEITGKEYAATMSQNLSRLLASVQQGTYKARPLLAAYIPKPNGESRKINIPTHEDKIIQRAVLTLLEPLFEPRFLPCSFGSRPKRSAGQAVDSLRKCLARWRGAWVLKVDIRKFFDNIKHDRLMDMLFSRSKAASKARLSRTCSLTFACGSISSASGRPGDPRAPSWCSPSSSGAHGAGSSPTGCKR